MTGCGAAPRAMPGSDDDEPLPTLEEEVGENVYDWSDPERNDYDTDDSFIAGEDSDDDDNEVAEDGGDTEVRTFSPATLARVEAQGRPSRQRQPPVRYSPPVDDHERYNYACLGADDDGASDDDEPTPSVLDEDDGVYSPALYEEGTDGSSSGSDDDEGAAAAATPHGTKRRREDEDDPVSHVTDEQAGATQQQ